MKKKFDTIKWMRSVRDQMSKKINDMTDKQIIAYFRGPDGTSKRIKPKVSRTKKTAVKS